MHRKRKRGPTANPLNKTNLMFQKREKNKEASYRKLLTHPECVWATSSRGALRECSDDVCCKDYECSKNLHSSEWTQTVSDLRQHYATLNAHGKRLFIAGRTQYTAPKQSDIKLERSHYYRNRMRAILHPEMYLSLIIDGADQSKHKVPHDPDASHLLEETVRQQLYAYGVLSHGRKAYTYLLPGHVKQGHDVTIEVLWRVINDVKENEGKLIVVFNV